MRFLIALVFSLLPALAQAGYAQATPPSNWTPAAPGRLATMTKVPGASNSSPFMTTAKISAAGRFVSVPAQMRFASNLPQYAASAIFRNPSLRVLPVVGQWLTAAGLAYWLYDEVVGWSFPGPDPAVSDGYIYCFRKTVSGNPDNSCSTDSHYRFFSKVEAGEEWVAACVLKGWSNCRIEGDFLKYSSSGNTFAYSFGKKSAGSSCPSGWYVTPAGCVQQRPDVAPQPLSEEDFVEGLTPQTMPDSLPNDFPAPLPVEVPQIAPTFIPQGDPQPNPAFDPEEETSPENAPFIQPGFDVKPAPSPSSPWQVDIQPRNRPIEESSPDPALYRDPASQPFPAQGSPTPSPTLPPDDVTDDLCAKHPEIVACQVLEEPESPGELPETDIGFDFQPETGFGGSASCPAPTVVTVSGQTIEWTWDSTCDTLQQVRPMGLAFAWLAALFIFIGRTD